MRIDIKNCETCSLTKIETEISQQFDAHLETGHWKSSTKDTLFSFLRTNARNMLFLCSASLCTQTIETKKTAYLEWYKGLWILWGIVLGGFSESCYCSPEVLWTSSSSIVTFAYKLLEKYFTESVEIFDFAVCSRPVNTRLLVCRACGTKSPLCIDIFTLRKGTNATKNVLFLGDRRTSSWNEPRIIRFVLQTQEQEVNSSSSTACFCQPVASFWNSKNSCFLSSLSFCVTNKQRDWLMELVPSQSRQTLLWQIQKV